MPLVSPLKTAVLGALIILSCSAFGKPGRAPEAVILGALLQGQDPGYLQAGHEWAALKPQLTALKTASYLQDQPYDPAKLAPERLLMLQNYLAPLLLTPEPGQAAALIECSSRDKALQRAAETGYAFVYDDTRGRGILVRKP